MANAEGGEATLFDGSGAARRGEDPRTRCCLMGLPEGEGGVFPLAQRRGVRLARTPSCRGLGSDPEDPAYEPETLD